MSTCASICERCGDEMFTNSELTTDEELFNLCDHCKKELHEFYHIVEKGGVLWRCSNCGLDGVIKPSEYTAAVRKSLHIEAPDVCGVEFSSCTEHNVTH